jgi:hypothetical protein
LDPLHINTNIVKRIGIDRDINSIVVDINHNLVSATIRLDTFSEKTITPLRKELARLLLTRQVDKEPIINSIITCIHHNIDCIKNSQPQQNKDKGEHQEKEISEEFIQQVNHNYLLSFYDNVKFIPSWFSDKICKIGMVIGHTKLKVYLDTLGFGFQTRCLCKYHNEESVIT